MDQKGQKPEFELGEIIYENAFSSPADIADWVIESSIEGSPAITFPHGRMRMESECHFLLWCPQDFPDNIAVSWDFRPRTNYGLAMFWIAVKGRNGEDLFDPSLAPRDGGYKQYHNGDINALHASYYRRNHGNREIHFRTCNLRKSYGFHMACQGGDPLPDAHYADEPYRIQVLKAGPHFRFLINDLIVYHWVDDGESYGAVLEDGKIGFRQMKGLIADYSNLQVQKVKNSGH